MTPELTISLVVVGSTLLSASVSGGVVWGLLRGDVTRTATDMCAVKKALGLEPSNGEIKSAFVPRGECDLKERRSDTRLRGCEEKLEGHEHRLTAAETRIDAGG